MGSAIAVKCSDKMQKYFDDLKAQAEQCLSISVETHRRGLDPELKPEIIMTEDLAARVEGLVGPKGIAQRIREVAELGQSREILSLTIAQELVKEMSKKNRLEAVDQAVRTGLAILTEGVLVAPLEGIAKVDIEKNPDGTEFISIFFAGPIRSAGGTGQALSVLIADAVRRSLGIDRYKATNAEIERMKEEMSLYHRRMHLQYEPTQSEIELIVGSCPVCVDGEGTEDEEVSGYRNISRIKTTNIRGGACLVIAEGLCLKAAKIQKIVKQMDIKGWEFIDEIVAKKLRKDDGEEEKKKSKRSENSEFDKQPELEPSKDYNYYAPGEISGSNIEVDNDVTCVEVEEEGGMDICNADESRIKPNAKYMRDSLAGRPVFANPSRKGGFRLRYGRARTTGLAALAINPTTMYLLGEFLAIGTQMKIERPGKAGVVTSCDQIEGPIVLLKDQSLIQLNSIEEVMDVKDNVQTIVDVGEMLIPFGEFVENNHDLVPGAYDANWWRCDLEFGIKQKLGSSDKADHKNFEKYITETPTAEEAFDIAKELNIPLHPSYNLFWHDISLDQLIKLREYIIQNGSYKNNILEIKNNKEIKNILITLCALHKLDKKTDNIVITYYSLPLLRCLGIDENLKSKVDPVDTKGKDIIENVASLAGIMIRSRGPTRIGASMGRPEKAKERKMRPPVHVLFPIGNAGGVQRLVKTAAENNKIPIEAGLRKCKICGKKSMFLSCDCGGHTQELEMKNGDNYNRSLFKQDIPIKEILSRAQQNLKEDKLPGVKGVIGLMSKNKTPEPLEKGILRAKHEVYVFKDGTIRFDMTDVPLTHFKPLEIGTSIEKLHELGYTHDYHGRPLSDPEQIVELKIQDLVPSKSCGEYLLRVSKYIDDLLVKFYHMEKYYGADTPSDMLGHIVMGLSPHTSGAVLGRIIGYTRSRVGYAHPFYHAAKRRNCDGDEDCVILFLDGLINFSRAYLPGTRGGFMDAPLVLMTHINPNEIDKEAQNVDIESRYPLEFYNATLEYAKPKELEKVIELVSNRIGTPGQFENFGFMFDTTDINVGPRETAYTRLGSMISKMEAQLGLAKQIDAVDESMVAAKVIESHFLPDMIGNLRSFSKQSFRCPKCRTKYRRIPLRGVCTKRKTDGKICGNKLTMTVHKGGVKKYLEVAKDIAVQYGVPKYTHQRILLNEKAINSTFENDKVKKFTLDEFI